MAEREVVVDLRDEGVRELRVQRSFEREGVGQRVNCRCRRARPSVVRVWMRRAAMSLAVVPVVYVPVSDMVMMMMVMMMTMVVAAAVLAIVQRVRSTPATMLPANLLARPSMIRPMRMQIRRARPLALSSRRRAR